MKRWNLILKFLKICGQRFQPVVVVQSEGGLQKRKGGGGIKIQDGQTDRSFGGKVAHLFYYLLKAMDQVW